MEKTEDDGKPYYVVRFIEVPFEGINNYVCVPHSWIIIRRSTDKKVTVAYPNNEDRRDTRDRVERKERYSETWMFYMAEIRYETSKLTLFDCRFAEVGSSPKYFRNTEEIMSAYVSESFKEAEYWIASRNDYRPVVEKEPRRKGKN